MLSSRILRAFILFAAAATITQGCAAPTESPHTPPSPPSPSGTGNLEIVITGLPAGVAGKVSVFGPNGFSRVITATTTFTAVDTGLYTTAPDYVRLSDATYGPSIGAEIEVTTSQVAAVLTVSYQLHSGEIVLTIIGLPAGVPANVSVGEAVYGDRTVTASGTLGNVLAGTNEVVAHVVSKGSVTYGGVPPTQFVDVAPSATPAVATVTYSAMTAQLTVFVGGSGPVSPNVQVSGPLGFSRLITAAGITTLTSLPLGDYSISAGDLTDGGDRYISLRPSQEIHLTVGALSATDTVWYEFESYAFAYVQGTTIFAENADGTGPIALDTSAAGPLAWSPDGKSLAFTSYRDHHAQIYLVRIDGSSATNLSANAQADLSPVWSPDGQRIAFVQLGLAGGELRVMNADGSGQYRVSSDSTVQDAPSWAPDGSRIAFESRRDGHNQIYVIDADGSGEHNVSNDLADDFLPAWSPDGTRIAFATDRDGNMQIYAMRADGSAPSNLSKSTTGDTDPIWSPDGTRIAFLHNGVGSVMNSDGSNLVTLVGRVAPAWSPNGSRIAFEQVERWCGRWSVSGVPPHIGSCIQWIMVNNLFSANPDGNNPIPLTNSVHGARWAAWRPTP
jgi:Tol biopolymer transport system component